MNLKKIGAVFASKFVGTGPSSYKKRIYRAAVSQRLRNKGLKDRSTKEAQNHCSKEVRRKPEITAKEV